MLDATPLLRLYARRRLARLRRPATDMQEAEFARLLRRGRATRFGRDHGFERIRTIADYQDRVPLRRYEQFWSDYWQSGFPVLRDCTWPGTIPFFANSSGTSSGKTKFIPVTPEMVRANRRAALDLLVFHIQARPASRILGGKSFMLGGSTDLPAQAPGIRLGDLSGIAARTVPAWARARYFPAPEMPLPADWEEKVRILGPLSLDQDIRAIGGTVSWLLLYIEQLQRQCPDLGPRLVDLYPDLDLVFHGGVSFTPYRNRFNSLLEGSHAETREVYPASEGFVGVADRGPGEGLRLISDNGLFYEFVPVEELGSPAPRRHWLGTIETGVDYAIVLTSCAGLWSYLLGDVVRFVDRMPPRLLVVGRTSQFLSAFGEHLLGEEIERAMAIAAAAIDRDVNDFAVAPIFPEQPGAVGRHRYVVEFSSPPASDEQLAIFAGRLDRALADINADYAEHRSGNFGMGEPDVRCVPAGTFARWMKQRGKMGGQNKVPRVQHDAEALDALLALGAENGR